MRNFTESTSGRWREMLQTVFQDSPWAVMQAPGRRNPKPAGVRDSGATRGVWSRGFVVRRDFVKDEPFLLLLGDHVYISAQNRRCARQLIETAKEHHASVSAVKATPEHLIHLYGTVAGKRVHGQPKLYEVREVIEKPNPSLAELRFVGAWFATGALPCFFGMHVLEPTVMGF